jgi:hypothetical protein
MPYTNINVFRKKGAKIFSKNNLGATEFYGKMGEKNYSRLFSNLQRQL